MNYAGADAFASGFAKGFGIINSVYDRQENRAYRKEMLGMQRDLHDLKLEEADYTRTQRGRKETLQKLQAYMHIQKHGTAEEKQQLSGLTNEVINTQFNDQIGEGKTFTGLVPAGNVAKEQSPTNPEERPEWQRMLFGIGTKQPDGSVQQSYLSEKRSSDPQDRFMSLSIDEIVDWTLNTQKGNESITMLNAAVLAAGGSLAEKWSKPYAFGDKFAITNSTSGETKVLDAKNRSALSGAPTTAAEQAKVRNDTYDYFYKIFSSKDVNGEVIMTKSNGQRLNSSVETTMRILGKLQQHGQWIDPYLITPIVYRNGELPDQKTVKKLAVQQLEKEIAAEIQQGKPYRKASKEEIDQKAVDIMAQSRQYLPKVVEEMEALGLLGSGQKNKKTPDKDKTASNKTDADDSFADLSDEKIAYLKKQYKAGRLNKDAFIKTRGEKNWKRIAGEEGKPKNPPKPKPDPEKKDTSQSQPVTRDTPLSG